MFINGECVVLSANKVLKHSKPGRKLDQFTYRSFPQKGLCVVDTLQECLTRSKLRVDCSMKKLLITRLKNFHATQIFRAAVTSKAKKLNVNMEDILKQCCWKNMKTFKKHYEKEIIYYYDDDVHFMKIINSI